jgi:ketosteroid isomerase-like protein
VETVEREVEQALRKFYSAIEDMVSGRGLDAMEAVWHHTPRVTSKHPMSDWALGWDEVWATWGIAATFGRADRGGSSLASAQVHVYGDIAYSTAVFQAAPAWGGERLLCTNVLQKLDGEWKIIHHHADPGPGMMAALERMIKEEAGSG